MTVSRVSRSLLVMGIMALTMASVLVVGAIAEEGDAYYLATCVNGAGVPSPVPCPAGDCDLASGMICNTVNPAKPCKCNTTNLGCRCQP